MKCCGIVLLAAAAVPAAVRAQEIRVYATSQAGDRLTAKPSLRFAALGAGGAGFHIDEKARDQQIIGFGASFLESGAICLNSLDSTRQEQVLQSLFDPEKGAGFTAMKADIAASDEMSAGPFYSYDDHPGDVGMKLFSIDRDLGPNGLIPYIKRARRYGRFVIQATMDYPPDWMLFDVNKNQDVNPKYFDALARYYLRYLREYDKQGIFIDYLSLFNEPLIYTKIPANKIRDLLKDHVGPLLAKQEIKTRIQPCEYNTRERASKYWPVILDDPQARKYTAAILYHGYDYKDYDKIAALHKQYPDLPLWMTEVCHAYEAGTPKTMVLPNRDYTDGDFWGTQIFNDLESGASAWIYWNMILDETGGPWAVSPVHGNPDPNVQHPVVIIDRQKKETTYTGLYYYLAHFSKFVRPGAVRVGVTGSVNGVRCLAFQAKDGGMIAEVMNSGKQPAVVRLDWRGQAVNLNLPALSITTYLWK
ncbi:MAG TPA: glycoside hydrolase family 30 beta sandwich domain-containing protein [Bryobacteraceae bacterium]|nr:glycoside hydrolase family 30 beta sandwich domain-containing protein [Bryobacteraceae bacterium]